MCRINGLLHLQSSKKIDKCVLTTIRDILEHRDPDDKGLFIENNIGFGHWRLSVIDYIVNRTSTLFFR